MECNAENILYTKTGSWTVKERPCSLFVKCTQLKKDVWLKKDRLLFVNATVQKDESGSFLSYDGGQTWAHKKCIEKGPSGYSSITICKNGDIGIFFENGTKMTFVRVTLK